MCKKLCAKVVCEGWCDEKWEKVVKKMTYERYVWEMICNGLRKMVCDKIMRKNIY
jgi:hypothetical protein